LTLDSVIWKKAEQKAKVFLRQVMGDDVFNKFNKNGKIEIKSMALLMSYMMWESDK